MNKLNDKAVDGLVGLAAIIGVLAIAFSAIGSIMKLFIR